jgi:hypothetical protein
MTARRSRIEVVPTDTQTRPRLPLSARKHFVRHIAGNGEPTWHSQSYSTRAGAVRGARSAADPSGLWVHVLDDENPPRIIRTYPPRGTR